MSKGTLPESLSQALSSLVAEARELEEKDKPAEEAQPKGKRAYNLRHTNRLSRQESFERLDELIEEARLGAPDEYLAKQANVSLEAVFQWRASKKIKRNRPVRKHNLRKWAVNVFGGPYDSELHAAESDLGGIWEVPEYVIRKPISYREFCRAVWFLHTQLGSGPGLVAEAIGVREKDVELALSVWSGHLAREGVKCLNPKCDEAVDRRYATYCCVRCAEGK